MILRIIHLEIATLNTIYKLKNRRQEEELLNNYLCNGGEPSPDNGEVMLSLNNIKIFSHQFNK